MFLKAIVNEDKYYSKMRDCAKWEPHKTRILNLWKQYKPYASRGFEKRIQKKFYEHWWEIYCGVGLLNLGFQLIKGNNKGPDFHFIYKGRNVFVEAIAPQCGTGLDALPTIDYNNIVSPLPEKEFLLRLASGLKDKAKKMNDYIYEGIVSKEDILIIAISACQLNLFRDLMDFPVSAIDKVWNNKGDLMLNLESGQNSIVPRNGISKKSGSPVETNLSQLPEFENITGIIYSYAGPLNDDELAEDSFVIRANTYLRKERIDMFNEIFSCEVNK